MGRIRVGSMMQLAMEDGCDEGPQKKYPSWIGQCNNTLSHFLYYHNMTLKKMHPTIVCFSFISLHFLRSIIEIAIFMGTKITEKLFLMRAYSSRNLLNGIHFSYRRYIWTSLVIFSGIILP